MFLRHAPHEAVEIVSMADDVSFDVLKLSEGSRCLLPVTAKMEFYVENSGVLVTGIPSTSITRNRQQVQNELRPTGRLIKEVARALDVVSLFQGVGPRDTALLVDRAQPHAELSSGR
jgi:hypothetical protein